jgi:hypothetical protein
VGDELRDDVYGVWEGKGRQRVGEGQRWSENVEQYVRDFGGDSRTVYNRIRMV